MRLRHGAVDEQRLHRAADARAAHLGVDDDLLRHGEVGGFVDIDVAEAFEMGEDRHARLVLHAGDEAFPAARHDDVDGAAEAGQHGADGGAVRHRHVLDRVLRQAGGLEAGDEAGMDSLR